MKTRLARELGQAEACEAYRTMVRQLLANLSLLEPVELRFTPDDAALEIQPWQRHGWTLAQQGTGDLGKRLEKAFNDAFSMGIQQVVIIGSDCPGVTTEDINSAWKTLERNDLVVGPATDGGYWLIGLRSPQPDLFRDISWSTARVLEQTLRKAEALGLKATLLQLRSDIDSRADWEAFLKAPAPAAKTKAPGDGAGFRPARS